MAREIHNLTDPTRDTLTDNVKVISDNWNKSPGYLYAILSEDKTDPFAPFLSMYRGILKSGISTCKFDSELEFQRERHGGPVQARDAVECFTDKTRIHGLTIARFMQAISDGELTQEEITDLENCLEAEEHNIALTRQMLNSKKASFLKAV